MLQLAHGARPRRVPIEIKSSSGYGPATAEELIAHCQGKLAKFKVPKDVTFIDVLPRNPSGKVLKRELRLPG